MSSLSNRVMWKLAKTGFPDIVCTEHSRVDHGTESGGQTGGELHLHTDMISLSARTSTSATS
jgi:hypothetical protein